MSNGGRPAWGTPRGLVVAAVVVSSLIWAVVSLGAAAFGYRPSVIGIKRLQYEPSGEAYNLLFEQRALALDTREIVVYNPRDEQVATSHDSDLLQFTSHDLERRRGYYAVRDTPHLHWKY